MKAQELQQLSDDELRARIEEMERDYYRLQQDVMSGKEQNHTSLRDARRGIARAKTVLRQRA